MVFLAQFYGVVAERVLRCPENARKHSKTRFDENYGKVA